MKYDWILFDADNTLFDYEKAEANALGSTFNEIGAYFQPHYAERYKLINTQIWLDFEAGKISQERLRTRRFELLLDEIGVVFDPEAFGNRYLEYLAQSADLIRGAEDVVRQLHDEAGLVLITNGIKEVQRSRFEKSALKDYFAGIVISGEVGSAKPDKGIFDAAFEKMNCPAKSRVLIVGDSLTSDMKGGAAYGIDTCWYNPKGALNNQDFHITYEIGRLEELAPLLNGA